MSRCGNFAVLVGPNPQLGKTQGAYNSGKLGNFGDFVNSWKLWEFEIYSGNFCISDAIFLDAI